MTTDEERGDTAGSKECRISHHLERALKLCKDDEAKYHIREALQLARSN